MRNAIAPLLLLTLTPLAHAAPQGADARSSAMGGTGVASSKYWNAAFTNPALLTTAKEDDKWGIVLPNFGFLLSDPDDLIDAADDFGDQFDAIDDTFDDGGTPTQGELDSLADSLLALDSRFLRVDAIVGSAVTLPMENFSLSVLARTRIELVAFSIIDPLDAAAIRGALTADSLPDLDSTTHLNGAVVTEFGVALARKFEIGGHSVSIGVTPKAQKIETINYAADANSFDDNDGPDPDDDRFSREDSGFNLDLGATVSPIEDWTFGLLIRDLITQDVKSVTTLGRSFTYSVEPVATAGAAWTSGNLTLAGDLDLTKREPLDFLPGSQYLSLGAEYSWSWAQLRGGFRTDIESETDDLLTAGIGLSPWQVFHFDLTGMVGDDTIGVALQTSLSF